MNRREFLKGSSAAAAMGLLASQGLSLARAQADQTYTMVTFLSGISYWADAYRGMQAAGEFLGVKTQYVGTPEYDTTGEVRVLEETLGQQPDGVVLTVIQAD